MLRILSARIYFEQKFRPIQSEAVSLSTENVVWVCVFLRALMWLIAWKINGFECSQRMKIIYEWSEIIKRTLALQSIVSGSSVFISSFNDYFYSTKFTSFERRIYGTRALLVLLFFFLFPPTTESTVFFLKTIITIATFSKVLFKNSFGFATFYILAIGHIKQT